MAALPVSPGSLNNIARFAYDVCQSCKASKGQFEKVGRETFAVKTAVELVALELEEKQLPVNILDADSMTKTYYKQLGIHIGNCQQALQAAHDCLRKYDKMAAWQQLRWGRSGREEIDSLVADLASFATQLDSFVGALNIKGIGKMLGRIGRVEQLLDTNGRNEIDAVDIIMAEMTSMGMPSQNYERYQSSITNYAEEINKVVRVTMGSGKRNKSDSPGERKKSDTNVATTNARLQKRSRSVDTVKSTATSDLKRSHSANPSPGKRASKQQHTLECWLIQIKAGNFTFLAWQKSGKEFQPRGQHQLEEMARQFRASKTSKYPDEYDLVGWVVEDRQKAEPDPVNHEWRPYAAKLERKGDLVLDQGVEEQAMVIISRELTAQAALRADEEEKAAQARKEAEKRAAKAEAVELKKKVKMELARRKSEDAAAEKAEKERREQMKRRAEIKHLKQQVAMLRLNQQPTLADKPEALAEKKRAEKRAREKAERDRRIEMEERAANLRKVELALFPELKLKGKEVAATASGATTGKEGQDQWKVGPPHQPSSFAGCRGEGRIQVSSKMFE